MRLGLRTLVVSCGSANMSGFCGPRGLAPLRRRCFSSSWDLDAWCDEGPNLLTGGTFSGRDGRDGYANVLADPGIVRRELLSRAKLFCDGQSGRTLTT